MDKKKPRITITVLGYKGEDCPHHKTRVGSVIDFYRDRARFCPLALHRMMPCIDDLQDAAAANPGQPVSYEGDYKCPSFDVVTRFRIDLFPPDEE